jgi:hypothetical protein
MPRPPDPYPDTMFPPHRPPADPITDQLRAEWRSIRAERHRWRIAHLAASAVAAVSAALSSMSESPYLWVPLLLLVTAGTATAVITAARVRRYDGHVRSVLRAMADRHPVPRPSPISDHYQEMEAAAAVLAAKGRRCEVIAITFALPTVLLSVSIAPHLTGPAQSAAWSVLLLGIACLLCTQAYTALIFRAEIRLHERHVETWEQALKRSV